MRRFVLALIAGLMLVSSASAADYVRGYWRSSGTYVPGHYRSSPNSSFYDNYSTRGNYNPYTGSPGYRTYPSYRSYYSSPYRSYYGY